MATFETFNLLFTANATQLKKEVDDVKKKTKETTDVLKDTEEQTKKTDNEFVNLSKSLAAVATAYFSVGSIVGAFKTSIAQTTDFANFARDFNVPIETLSAWSGAVKNFGADSQAFLKSVEEFAKKGNLEGETAFEFLLIFSDKLKAKIDEVGITAVQRWAQEQTPFNADAIAYLGQGRAIVEADLARQKELGVITEKDAAAAREFNSAVGKLSDAFDDLHRIMVTDILPVLTGFAEFLTGLVSTFTFRKEDPLGVFERRLIEKNPSLLDKNPELKERYEKSQEYNRPKEEIVYAPTNTVINKAPTNITMDANGTQIPLPPLPPISSFQIPEEFNSVPQIPTKIAGVTNSQSRAFHMGDININTTAQDAKDIGKQVVEAINQRENQYWASNNYFDDGVVI